MKRIIFKQLTFFVTIIIFLLFISGCAVNPTAVPQKAVEIATRLHISPSWDRIRDYLQHKAFSSGMSREEVHVILDQIGPWKVILSDSPNQGGWDSDTKQFLFRENIRFLDKETSTELSDWGFLYDKDNKLVRQGSIDYAVILICINLKFHGGVDAISSL